MRREFRYALITGKSKPAKIAEGLKYVGITGKKNHCKDCGGTQICPHNRQKADGIEEQRNEISRLEAENEHIEERMSLRDRVKLIFKKYGFTVFAVVSAVGLVIGVIVNKSQKRVDKSRKRSWGYVEKHREKNWRDFAWYDWSYSINQSIMAASAEQHAWHASPPGWSYRLPALICRQFPNLSSGYR